MRICFACAFFTYFAAFITCLYSIRSLIIIFISQPNYSFFFNSFNFLISIPVILLSLGAIYFGYLFNDLIFGLGSDVFSNSIFIHPINLRLTDSLLSEFTIYKFACALPLIRLRIFIFIYPFPSNGTHNSNIDFTSSYLTSQFYYNFPKIYILNSLNLFN